MLDSLRVENPPGTVQPLRAVAAVRVAGPTSLVVTPYDGTGAALAAVRAALRGSRLDLSVDDAPSGGAGGAGGSGPGEVVARLPPDTQEQRARVAGAAREAGARALDAVRRERASCREALRRLGLSRDAARAAEADVQALADQHAGAATARQRAKEESLTGGAGVSGAGSGGDRGGKHRARRR